MTNCCEKCFPSPYLKDIIQSKNNKWNCDFCWSKEIFIYNPLDLSPLFENLLDIYIIDDEWMKIEDCLSNDFPNEIFSKEVEWNKRKLLESIFWSDNLIEDYYEKISGNVILNKSLILDEKLINDWEWFVNEIKTINRFHIINTLDKDKLKVFFNTLTASKSKWNIFFRARKCEETSYLKEEMWKPPREKSMHWRANPKGISYLYLASDEETTYYEIRATLLNNLTIWKFSLQKDIILIDLREDSYSDIIQLAEWEQLSEFLKNKPFIKKLDLELSKPYSNDDKELDYLPTQYISEFIKSLGYAGVIYNSSLSPKGYNLVIFNGDELECVETRFINIKGIKFEPEEIKKESHSL